MRHDETRDNTTAIEATIIEADNRDMTPVNMDNPREGWFDAVVTREDAPAKLHQGLGGIEGSDKTGRETWDERCQRMAEEAEDDGQPDEYTEWQDYMGGDEYYDHSENACW
jgi:hypothetical protein